jgi:hypothetical protein
VHRRKFLTDSLIGAPLLMGKRGSERFVAKRVEGPDASATATDPRRCLEFSRMLVHWTHYIEPGYLPFVDEVQPEVVQVGFYGAEFWAIAHVRKADMKGANAAAYAVDGDLKGNGQFFENLNKELHKRGIKVVGHFDVELHVTGLIDGPQGPREGFFDFYNKLWDEKELGPKPVKDPLELIQRNADGSPSFYNLPAYSPWPMYHGCLNNPNWQKVLKAFVKRGIERGVDGFVINHFYLVGCVCQYCVRGFKDYLRQRYRPAELRRNFGIEDLEKHEFAEIVGSYQPGNMTPLRLEELRFSHISRKQAFDEIFIAYGRSLKPDLILAAWLHGHYTPSPADERLMLPPELWAKGEDYIWYS